MSLDGITIGVLGLIIAGLGVAATLLTPRFVGGARLNFVPGRVSTLRRREQIGTLRIAVLQGQEEVKGNIYLFGATVSNCGSKDVSHHDFVDPIIFYGVEGVEILSIDGQAKQGIGAIVKLEKDVGFLEWRILKPKEEIYIEFVVRSINPVDFEPKNRLVESQIRLKDVKSGKSVLSKLKLTTVAVVFIGMTAVLNTINFIPFSSRIPIHTIGSKEYVIRSGLFGTKECLVKPELIYVSRCVNVTERYAEEALARAEFKEASTGISSVVFFLSLVVSLFYALLVAYGSRPLSRMVSRFETMTRG
jgi:hypothetical protein